MDIAKLQAMLIEEEGLKLLPYRDTTGHLTIGIGRNLDDVGISPKEALYLSNNDVARAIALLDEYISWWDKLDDVRQRVLVDMVFNMGWRSADGQHGLSTFRNTLALIQAGNYAEAADGMLKSRWALQVGDRARRLAGMMRSGIDIPLRS